MKALLIAVTACGVTGLTIYEANRQSLIGQLAYTRRQLAISEGQVRDSLDQSHRLLADFQRAAESARTWRLRTERVMALCGSE